jgi:hypothetical protein
MQERECDDIAVDNIVGCSDRSGPSNAEKHPSRELLHRGQNVRQCLVCEIHTYDADPWAIKVENDVDRQRHDKGKPDPMKIHAEGFTISQPIAGQQRSEQRQ